MSTPGYEPMIRDEYAHKAAVEKAIGRPILDIEYIEAARIKQPDSFIRAAEFRRASEPITVQEVPVWTEGWTAGYAAGIKRALAECPTHGTCPNCREGWGHYTPEHGHLPTVESEQAKAKQ